MGDNINSETTSLLPPKGGEVGTAKPLRFPLGLVPEHVRPYLELIRIDKPTGAILMFWPFAWGLTLAAYRTDMPLDRYAVEFAKSIFAGFIVRCSACTVNDIFDRKVDAGVERTKNRPLASGRISVTASFIYLFVQYGIGVAFFYTMSPLAFWVAMVQMLPVFAIYPLLKRVTHWPQAWLGFAMNFGVVISWTATTNEFDWVLNVLMMAGCWCWTMLYDTIYACQDMKDDVKMGVRSTALLFGSWIRPLLYACGVTFVAMLAGAGVVNHQGPAYFALTVGGTAAQLIWQFATVDLNVPESCWVNFKRNGHLGWVVWGGLFLDYILHVHFL